MGWVFPCLGYMAQFQLSAVKHLSFALWPLYHFQVFKRQMYLGLISQGLELAITQALSCLPFNCISPLRHLAGFNIRELGGNGP
jgi:hypothetical protein